MHEINQLIERGAQLRQLNRAKEAIVELQKALLIDPNSYDALDELFLCHFELHEDSRAEELVNLLISIAPDNSFPHYYKALVELRKKNYETAETSILQAIEIAPYIATFFGVLSAIFISQYEWKKALDYANQGLELDPENSTCLNYRTQCLTKLNRYDEVDDSIEDTLKSDPYDEYTHANIGWIQLEKNNNEQAQIHFAESLRINPNSSYARQGMIESIKAKNWFYRQFLNYQFFMSKHKKPARLAIIIALFVGYQYLDKLTNDLPILLPFYYLIGFMFYFTWISTPVSNLFFRFDTYGKIMLTTKEKRCSEIVGLGLLIGFIASSFALVTNYSMWWHLALVSFSIVVPLYHAIEYDYLKNKNYLALLFIVVLLLAGIHSLYYLFIKNSVMNTAHIYSYALVAYSWLFNLGIIKHDSDTE